MKRRGDPNEDPNTTDNPEAKRTRAMNVGEQTATMTGGLQTTTNASQLQQQQRRDNETQQRIALPGQAEQTGLSRTQFELLLMQHIQNERRTREENNLRARLLLGNADGHLRVSTVPLRRNSSPQQPFPRSAFAAVEPFLSTLQPRTEENILPSLAAGAAERPPPHAVDEPPAATDGAFLLAAAIQQQAASDAMLNSHFRNLFLAQAAARAASEVGAYVGGAAAARRASSIGHISTGGQVPPNIPPQLSRGSIQPMPVGSSDSTPYYGSRSSMDSENPLAPPQTFPCKARGMPADHDSETAVLEVTTDANHGDMLFCSHPSCREKGSKFRYCSQCNIPVARRNFRSRHDHGLLPARAGGSHSKGKQKDPDGDDRQSSSLCSDTTTSANLESNEEEKDQQYDPEEDSKPPYVSRREETVESPCMEGPAEEQPTTEDATMEQQESSSSSSNKIKNVTNDPSDDTQSDTVELSVSFPRRLVNMASTDRFIRWAELLGRRPACEEDGGAMAAWLNEVITVSDLHGEPSIPRT